MFKKIFIGISFVAVTLFSTTTIAEDGVVAAYTWRERVSFSDLKCRSLYPA